MVDSLTTDFQKDFDRIVSLIQRAQYNAVAQVNAEMINLYYEVGRFVSGKVESAEWGTGVVDKLADFIVEKHPDIKGFTRRGLYRMKQFYELYSPASDCFQLLVDSLHGSNPYQNVSALPSHLNTPVTEQEFVTALLSQISWSHHLEISDRTKVNADG